MNSVVHLVGRLGSLQRSEMRKFAQTYGLQLVHLETISYLFACNRYSDNLGALTEYLGQTKGSVSQTVGHLEHSGLLTKRQDANDRRMFHLTLTAKATRIASLFREHFFGDLKASESSVEAMAQSLRSLQQKNNLRSFGICATCRFNTNPSGRQFVCVLTGETLSKADVQQICREHEYSAA